MPFIIIIIIIRVYVRQIIDLTLLNCFERVVLLLTNVIPEHPRK